eukprot:2325584-Rhodomonas_salina.1
MALAMNQRPISHLGRSSEESRYPDSQSAVGYLLASRDASRDCCLDHQQLESVPWAPCRFSLKVYCSS